MGPVRHFLLAVTVLCSLGSGCAEAPRSGGGGSGSGGVDMPRPERTACTQVNAVEGPNGFAVFAYEASRPNATSVDSGALCDADEDCATNDFPACSEAGLMPWTEVTRGQAAAACERSGWRLCTEAEWLLACGGADHLNLPYGRVHRPGYCNDHKSGSNAVQAAGTREQCVSPVGAVDIVGNVWEWIADRGDGGENRYLGYSYRVSAIRPTADPACDAGLQTGQEGYDRPEVGFRCCKDLEG